MFDIIKTIIWIAGILVVGYFVMNVMGYKINESYFSYSKEKCQEKITECSKTVLRNGINNTDKCDFNCVDPQLIIKKK